jgi:hypothetical protein
VKSLAGFIVVDVLASVLPQRLAGWPFAKQFFKDSLHLSQRYAIL